MRSVPREPCGREERCPRRVAPLGRPARAPRRSTSTTPRPPPRSSRQWKPSTGNPVVRQPHRGGGRESAHSTTLFEDARSSVARFVGCADADNVVFVRNTTEAANLLAVALPIGTRVLCSPFEHHANLLPWREHRVTHLPFTPTAVNFLDAVSMRSRRPTAPATRSPSSRSPAPRTSRVRCRRSRTSPGWRMTAARSSSSMPRSWRPTVRSTSTSSEPTSLPSPATRFTPRSGPERSSPQRQVSRTDRRSSTEAAQFVSSRSTMSPGLRHHAGSRPGRRTSSGRWRWRRRATR